MPNLKSTLARHTRKLVLLSLAASILLATLALACGGGDDSTAPQVSPTDPPAPTATLPPTQAPATTALIRQRRPIQHRRPRQPPPRNRPGRNPLRPGRRHDAWPAVRDHRGIRGAVQGRRSPTGVDVVVALETEEIIGGIDLEAGTATVAIDLHTLVSDQARRDRYVRERLFPDQPIATVESPILETYRLVLRDRRGTGSHASRDRQRERRRRSTDFEITARLDSDEDLVVLGTTDFVWADFGMTAPVSSIFTVADEVRAELLLYAKAN